MFFPFHAQLNAFAFDALIAVGHGPMGAPGPRPTVAGDHPVAFRTAAPTRTPWPTRVQSPIPPWPSRNFLGFGAALSPISPTPVSWQSWIPISEPPSTCPKAWTPQCNSGEARGRLPTHAAQHGIRCHGAVVHQLPSGATVVRARTLSDDMLSTNTLGLRSNDGPVSAVRWRFFFLVMR